MLYIHPVSWRRKSNNSLIILNKVLSKKLLYIYTNNNFTDFGISAPFINYYLLQNKPYDDEYLTKYETVFNDKMYKGEIHLNKDLEFIPVFLSNETMNILSKVMNKSGECNLIYLMA